MGNKGQYIILLLAISFSFLSWLISRLREQAAINRIKQERARQRQEALRTGRGVESAAQRQPSKPQQPPSRRPDLQALALQRQAQLRALRQQQLARLKQQTQRQRNVLTPGVSTTAPAPPAASAPRASAAPPVVRLSQHAQSPRRAPPSRKSTPPRRVATPRVRAPGASKIAKHSKPAGARQGNLAAYLQKQASKEKRRWEKERADARKGRLLKDTHEQQQSSQSGQERSPTAESFSGKGMTRAQWRRAIVMSEMLAPPVALRTLSDGL